MALESAAAFAYVKNRKGSNSNLHSVVSSSLPVLPNVWHKHNRINQRDTLLQGPMATATFSPRIPKAEAPKASASRAAQPHNTMTPLPPVTSTAITTSRSTSTAARVDYILITTDYERLKERTFWQKYGRIILIAVCISLGIACISILIVTVHCYRATALKRRATVALALPIPHLPDDQILLHTEPDNPVPMLSVQTAGCAGMERLGVPTRTTLNTPPDDRGQFSCRMRVDALQACELLAVRGETVIHSSNNSSSSSNNHHQHHNQHSSHQHQQHLQPHQQQQHQHYQRTTTPNYNSGSRGSGRGGSNMPTRSNYSINNSSSCYIPTSSATNNSSSNFVRGGIEATTLKYGNTGSGSSGGAAGGGSGGGGGGNSISGSSSLNSRSMEHHQHYQHELQQQTTLHCPHHVPLPDSEWGQDRNLQIRTGYQQSEITRSYIKPPPNKTVKDVPEQSSYNFHTLTTLSSSSAGLHGSTTSLTHPQSQHQSHHHHHKSKPNVISKLFSRKSSPKSPTTAPSSSAAAAAAAAALSASSTCSSLASSTSMSSMPSASSSASSLASVSTSSSASSLSSAPIATLPLTTASSLKTTPCSYGASSMVLAVSGTPAAAPLTASSCASSNILAVLAPTTQLLTTLSVPPAATVTLAPAAATAEAEYVPTPASLSSSSSSASEAQT